MLAKITRPVFFAYTYLSMVRNPNQLDNVFDLIDRLDDLNDGTVPADLAQRPAIRSFLAQPYKKIEIDPDALATLPLGTLGRTYADWMRQRGLSPRSLREKSGDNELARLRNHAVVTHDIWHVVTGFDTDVAGEAGLQAFYLAQNGGGIPLALMSAIMLNTLIYAVEDGDRRMNAIVRGWTLGKRCQPLFGTDWTELWETPLDDVRSQFAIDDLPPNQLSVGHAAA
ncbi:MAG: hypothetical protein Tsb0020_07340 [Haliangiales bacterium]